MLGEICTGETYCRNVDLVWCGSARLAQDEEVTETSQDDGRLLQSVYALISDAVRDPENGKLDQATRTIAWTVRELLFHLLLDAQRALVAFATPAVGPADVDSVTYWAPFRPANGDGGRAHAEYVTQAAAAYSSSRVLVGQWTETSAAAAWAARHERVEIVSTQGHSLRSADFIDTLIVEATIHFLDLTLNLHAPPAPGEALARVRKTLDGLLGTPLPLEWDDVECALKGTGRVALTAADRDHLGDLALTFPLLG
jgi:Mycothiol maleylpyruvate isomerase N-terminal domain